MKRGRAGNGFFSERRRRRRKRGGEKVNTMSHDHKTADCSAAAGRKSTLLDSEWAKEFRRSFEFNIRVSELQRSSSGTHSQTTANHWELNSKDPESFSFLWLGLIQAFTPRNDVFKCRREQSRKGEERRGEGKRKKIQRLKKYIFLQARADRRKEVYSDWFSLPGDEPFHFDHMMFSFAPNSAQTLI